MSCVPTATRLGILTNLLSISLLELNLKSYVSAQSRVIQPLQTLEQCLHSLLIHAPKNLLKNEAYCDCGAAVFI
jgi:hypothetical protein